MTRLITMVVALVAAVCVAAPASAKPDPRPPLFHGPVSSTGEKINPVVKLDPNLDVRRSSTTTLTATGRFRCPAGEQYALGIHTHRRTNDGGGFGYANVWMYGTCTGKWQDYTAVEQIFSPEAADVPGYWVQEADLYEDNGGGPQGGGDPDGALHWGYVAYDYLSLA